jgi:hypothetical protein
MQSVAVGEDAKLEGAGGGIGILPSFLSWACVGGARLRRCDKYLLDSFC